MTAPLAGLAGKIDEYTALKAYGLNTIEVDVKDENGQIGFVSPRAARARARDRRRAALLRRRDGRRQGALGRHVPDRPDRRLRGSDPVGRPAVATPLLRTDGSRWLNNGGLGWVNPYDQRVWRYAVGIGVAAAKAGFDEIQFDYVRFPSDGDLSQIVYRRERAEREGDDDRAVPPLRVVDAAPVRRARLGRRLRARRHPRPRDRPGAEADRRAYLDAIYPMVYPSHFAPGEYGITDPDAYPGRTVARALFDFRRQVKGTGDADPVAPGLLARAPVRADRGRPTRSPPPAGSTPAGSCSGTPRACTRATRCRVVTADAPPPPPLALVAPAEREVSFGRIAGRLPRGTWAVVVRVGDRSIAVRRVTGSSFDFTVALPRKEVTVRVAAYSSGRAAERATVPHVFGLPRSAAPRAVRATQDRRLGAHRPRARRGPFRGRARSTWRISSPDRAAPGTPGRASRRPRR